MKKVSIIIPCYNKEKYVKEAVESAINQTYKNIEIVCIDDASTDNSRVILKEITEKYNNLVLIEEDKNIGVCRARNKAIEISSGEYILPLDADDTIEPTYVEKAIDIFNKNPNIDVIYSRVRHLITKKEMCKPCDTNNLLLGNYITCSSVFKKSDFQKFGGYDIAFNEIGCEDWDLYLKFFENNLKFYQIDEILFNYRQELDGNRTIVQINSYEEILPQILFKYKDLYKKNGLFKEMFKSLILNKDSKMAEKKHLKYRKLFNLFLSITIVETVIIVAYFVYKIFILAL